MEKESFEDPEVAQILNSKFVSIKVDREERPDIDGFYMEACVAMSGSGGWPLTIIMTPDGRPFFTATYLPKHSRFGMNGLVETLTKVAELWSTKRREIDEYALTAANQVFRSGSPGTQSFLEPSLIRRAYTKLNEEYDETYAGFGISPKFPVPHRLGFLLRYYVDTGDPSALTMAEGTLLAMRCGGIYDQVGFGFHRYSVDRVWGVPHFEKMLYDQALLLYSYAEAYQVTKKPLYRRTLSELMNFLSRELASPEGGFYTSLDADSEGGEGRYYTWNSFEFEDAVPRDMLGFALRVFGVTKEGNFETEGLERNLNVLRLSAPPEELARLNGMSEEEFWGALEDVRRHLLAARGKRGRPSLDDKVLTDMNSLMIAGLAKSYCATDDKTFLEAAESCARFLFQRLAGSSPLLHRYRQGESAVVAMLDDYAFLIWGLIELYQATYKEGYLEKALVLLEESIQSLWDGSACAFYTTKDTGLRRVEFYDGALPSGNSVQAMNLVRMSVLTGEAKYAELAHSLLAAASSQASLQPEAFTQLLQAYQYSLSPQTELVAAARSSADCLPDIRKLQREFLPYTLVMLRTQENCEKLDTLAPFTSFMVPVPGGVSYYLCQRGSCSLPGRNFDEIAEKILGATRQNP
jgi:uncharacterized protein YyaL (SSP411 family)